MNSVDGNNSFEDCLSKTTFPIGKYKGSDLSFVLRDRNYCKWLLSSHPDFETKYEYLYNRISEYDPLPELIAGAELTGRFVDDYRLFNLKNIDDIKLELSESDIVCFNWYKGILTSLQNCIRNRIDEGHPKPYAIKAPVALKKRFINETGLDSSVLDEMIKAYDLPNIISSVMKDIKNEAGINYNGGTAFKIAKARSEHQEAFWETMLKLIYGESIDVQYEGVDKCIFDFINIEHQTVFECKLGFTEFNVEQFNKYNFALKRYGIVYIVGNNDTDIRSDHHNDYVVDMVNKSVYVLETQKADLETYILNIVNMRSPSYLDNMLTEFEVIGIEDMSPESLSSRLGMTKSRTTS